MSKRKTTEEFIKEAKQIHGDKYDYSKVEYKGCKTKVCIICPMHGEFWQTPRSHLQTKYGCPKCGDLSSSQKNKLTTEEFIEKARKVHGDKYDYSKTTYEGCYKNVCIICPKHGEYFVAAHNHLQGSNCPKCSKEKQMHSQDTFIKLARKVQGDKYDYSKVNYINNKTKICIICPTHGEFWQVPSSHLIGYGCMECGGKNNLTTEEFIKEAKEIHGDKYDYSKVEYINAYTKVCIICPVHGEFWQIPHNHVFGKGCPQCHSSHLEENIRAFLQDNKIDFNEQKHFEWLGKQSLDFYLPKYNVGIECQGG